jgi:hypothetical protein
MLLGATQPTIANRGGGALFSTITNNNGTLAPLFFPFSFLVFRNAIRPAIANKGETSTPFFYFFSMLLGITRPTIANKKGSFDSPFFALFFILCFLMSLDLPLPIEKGVLAPFLLLLLLFCAYGRSLAKKLCSLPLPKEREEGELQISFSMLLGAIGRRSFDPCHHQ